MRPEVHTASTAYAAQGVTLVNPYDRTGATVVLDRPRIMARVAFWLGVCSREEYETILRGGETVQNAQAIRMLEAIEAQDPALAADLRRRFPAMDLSSLRARIVDRIGVDPDDEAGFSLLSQIARDLELYHHVVDRPSTLSIDQLIAQTASPSRRALYQEYRGYLERAGIASDQVFLISDFPVVYLGVGFSRGGWGPEESDLVAYRGRVGRGQVENTLVYAHPQMTEALMFSLDEGRVRRWLLRNRYVTDEQLQSRGGVKGWFASKVGPSEGFVYEPVDGDHESEAAAALYRLLHTMAHQMLRALSIDSGFMETSLAEYFFPQHLAFAIYPHASGEFVIGGLRTVLEQALGDVIERALNNDQCIYDPNCRLDRGADHGCLFLPETACSNWNRALSRWELFGNVDLNGVRYFGYWDPDL